MRRWIVRGALGLLAVAGLVAGVFWARPDLLADLKRIGTPVSALPLETRTEKVEAPPQEELIDDGWCVSHRAPEATCARCQGAAKPEPGATRPCAQPLPLVQLASPEVARRIGLETTKAVARKHAMTIVGNAEIVYNANSYAEVTPRVPGIIREILTDEGKVHKKGDVLIVIDSAEVGSAKATYLSALPVVDLARSTLERTSALTKQNALPLKDELEAQAAFNRATADFLNASQRLRNLGFNDADLEAIARTRDTSSLLKITSPIEGTIVSRHAVTGEAVQATSQIFVVADLRVMWAWIDVYEADIERVKAGQPVRFTIGGGVGRVFEGHVDWIDAAVNPTTRTIRVRAEVANPDERLRSNQFGRAEIVVGQEHEAVFVSRQALQQLDGVPLVFLRRPDGRFQPQRLVIDAEETLGDEVEVAWGLAPGQEVVTTGAFLLKSELQKDQLAGD
jgi:cobalt-zinc-cadmium efflux system membrane fusion protein